MDLLEKFDLDPRYYRLLPGNGLVMLSPAACPNGHPLTPPNVTASATNHGGEVVHQWHCWTCGADWSSKPYPGAVHWPGVPVEPVDEAY